jgi:aryl-alcohol dehydrogenase-like predicted oxidoreductase
MNMGLTDYMTLGRSGLRVSPLCLGTMTMTFGPEWGFRIRGSHFSRHL